MDPGRRRHYGDFYDGVDGPLALVHGNCQAESLRVLLAGSPTFAPRPVRIPPVHELTADDLPHLHALLPRTTVLLSQPVRDGYRDLPLGTAELTARLAPGARVLRWPVVRYAGLHPWTVIVRHRSDMAVVPPVVPYHDLRTLTAAAGLPPAAAPTAAAFRAAADLTVAELAQRERGTDVGVSDLLRGLGVDAAHTLNHPGNPVLIALARRVQAALGLPADAEEPGRALLGGIRAPLDPSVLAALGLDAPPREHWIVDGVPVDDAEVRAAQLDWYRTHPQWVAAGLERHAERIVLLGGA
ncbi:WcbI family polysaccharide biosynthesis putative acetyltransferase [Pseudonocardia abyssalis]|uniref:WcbI family polysaccharide biosynthesis putative acetyltransferase n=1 Tax=Pseudonocardia abyssalis TaxID=2792008 RepID=UPI001C4A4AFA|nr:WcbI family polysaccharide biosynthesis putative acetyltransferase [Pseudonocardia abyssalis]